MRYVLLSLVVIGMMTYALLDSVRTDDPRIRLGLPHWFWVVVIIVLPGLGALTWLIVAAIGRRRYEQGSSARPSRQRPGKPVAPDDDPDFLFRLERDRIRRQKEQEAATGSGSTQDPAASEHQPPPEGSSGPAGHGSSQDDGEEQSSTEEDDAHADDDENNRY